MPHVHPDICYTDIYICIHIHMIESGVCLCIIYIRDLHRLLTILYNAEYEFGLIEHASAQCQALRTYRLILTAIGGSIKELAASVYGVSEHANTHTHLATTHVHDICRSLYEPIAERKLICAYKT